MRSDRNANYAVGFAVERPRAVTSKNPTVVDKQTGTLSPLMREIFAVRELRDKRERMGPANEREAR